MIKTFIFFQMIKTIFILTIAAVALAAPSLKAEAEATNDVLQSKATDMSGIIPEKHLDKRQIVYPYSPYQYGYYPLRYGAAFQQQYVQPIGGLSSYVQPIRGLSPYVHPIRGLSPYVPVDGLSSYRSWLSYIHNGLL